MIANDGSRYALLNKPMLFSTYEEVVDTLENLGVASNR